MATALFPESPVESSAEDWNVIMQFRSRPFIAIRFYSCFPLECGGLGGPDQDLSGIDPGAPKMESQHHARALPQKPEIKPKNQSRYNFANLCFYFIDIDFCSK